MPRLLALLLLCVAGAAMAGTADDAKKQLTGTLSEIQSAAKKQKDLEKKQEELEHEMKRLQEETVTISRDAKGQEEALVELEEKTGILEGQQKEKQAQLDMRKAELSDALSAMVKLSRLPPEAVIAMPGKVQETLSAARALGVITKTVQEEASSLKAQLRELDNLKLTIAKNHEDLIRKKVSLLTRQKQLAGKITERGKLHTALGGKAKEEKEKMQKLTERSKTLQDLVDTLNKEEDTIRNARNASPASVRQRSMFSSGKLRKQRSFAQSKGRIGLPVTGRIVGLYGHSEGGAAFSKGVMIESRGTGNVVAPYDGEVVYAGKFRDYGKMVIIRHADDYHTLLSGMDEINCAPGQFLLEGEPIGAMGKPAEGAKPRLYVEMRKSGKPIDPMGWFKG